MSQLCSHMLQLPGEGDFSPALIIPSKPVIQFPYRFRPRIYQQEALKALFLDGKKRILSFQHRRAGKDQTAIHALHMKALMRPGLYIYLLPKVKQARAVIWEGRNKAGKHLMDCIPKQFIKKDVSTTMTRYLTNGSIIRIGGSDKFDSWMGTNPLMVVLSEYSLCHPLAWDYFRPILTENGGEAWFTSTPRGHNHAYDLYSCNADNDSWYVCNLTVDDTTKLDGSRVITPEQIEEDRRSGMSESLIQQEYYGSFEAALPGAYFHEEMAKAKEEGRICKFAINPMLPVHTAWDIGMRDSTIILLFQREGQHYKFFDCIEGQGKGMHYYFEEMEKAQKKHGFHRYGMHYAPHDIAIREWAAGRSRMDQARRVGMNFIQVPSLGVMEGIQALRYMFQHILLHQQHCAYLIDALLSYHSEYDYEKKTFSDPVHDWSSHYVDAMRMFAVGYLNNHDREMLNRQRTYARSMPKM